MRIFPNMVVMAPGDHRDVIPMLDFALGHSSPVSIRYPRANLHAVEREVQPIELGQAEIIDWETDGMIRRLRRSAWRLPASRRPAPQAVRTARRGHQCPVHQAARPRDDLQGDRRSLVRADRRGRLPAGRLRLGRA